MPTKYFTVAEANDLLIEIKPLVQRMMTLRAEASAKSEEISNVIQQHGTNTGSLEASKMTLKFAEIERLAKQIRAYGCEIKNLNVGLLDFLALRDGREVFLCWRYGEDEITQFHELHTGFNGRNPIDFD